MKIPAINVIIPRLKGKANVKPIACQPIKPQYKEKSNK